jgi:hypothetical protein
MGFIGEPLLLLPSTGSYSNTPGDKLPTFTYVLVLDIILCRNMFV